MPARLPVLAIVIGLLVGCQADRGARIESPALLDETLPSSASQLKRLAKVSEADAATVTGADASRVSFTGTLPEPVDPPTPPEQLAPPERSMTLDEFQQIANLNNPSLAEVRANLEAARGKWVQVGLPPNTEFGYSGQQLFSDGLAEQQGLFVGQEFIRGDKLRLNRAVAAQEIRRAEQLWAVQQMRVETDVRLAFYDVLVAQRRHDTAGELVRIAQEAAEAAEALFQAQEVSQLDVMRAKIEEQRAKLVLEKASNKYSAAWLRLAAVTGEPSMPSRPLRGDVEAAIGELNAADTLERLVSESPEMAAAISQVERARWAVDRAIAEPVPNVDVQAIVQSDNGTGDSNANLQVAMPIPWLDRNQGGIRAARAEVVAAERAVERLQLSLGERLATVFQRYATARHQVKEYAKQGGILANSTTTLEFVRRGYQAGELGYLDLITAQRTFSQTNLAYIEAMGEFWAAVIEIDGMLLKGSLDRISDIRP